MKIDNYKAINKGAIVARFNVILPTIGMTLRDCILFNKDGRKWIGLPSKDYIDDAGAKKYYALVTMELEQKRRFDNSVIELLEKEKISLPASR